MALPKRLHEGAVGRKPGLIDNGRMQPDFFLPSRKNEKKPNLEVWRSGTVIFGIFF